MPTLVNEDTLYNLRYDFAGRYCLAHAEAFKAILTHEKIPFVTGQGPNGTQCVFIKQEHEGHAKNVVQQWYEALHVVQRTVVGS